MPLRNLSPKLSPESHEAISATLDAISTCHSEMTASSDKVVEKLGNLAKTLGWPTPIIDGVKMQVQSAAKMQTQMIEHLMDACEAQLKSQNPLAQVPSEFLSRMQTWPGLLSPGSWPNADVFNVMSQNPIQFWMQLGEQWQKNWAQMISQSVK